MRYRYCCKIIHHTKLTKELKVKCHDNNHMRNIDIDNICNDTKMHVDCQDLYGPLLL